MGDFFREVANSIDQQDGWKLAKLLNLAKLPPSRLSSIMQQASKPQQLRHMAKSYLSTPWNDIVSKHLTGYALSSKRKHIEAFDEQSAAAELMYNWMMSDKETNWWLPGINVILLNLRLLSYNADDKLEQLGGKAKYMIQAQDCLKRYFQRMIIDRSAANINKKKGCLFVIIHLFKIYFKINNLRLCTNLINSVNNANFPAISSFPTAESVAYSYYHGRLMMFEEQYDKAEEKFDYAFLHCHKDSFNNKRTILQFLIPIKLLRGKYPKPALLSKYQLLQFDGLISATRNGSLNKFNEALEQNQDFFIKKGIFLLLEKLKISVYRNLIKKLHSYWQVHGPEKLRNKLSIDGLLTAAFRVNGIEMDGDELECILANLIFSGAIKGYIAHKRSLVLSKTDPFPVQFL